MTSYESIQRKIDLLCSSLRVKDQELSGDWSAFNPEETSFFFNSITVLTCINRMLLNDPPDPGFIEKFAQFLKEVPEFKEDLTRTIDLLDDKDDLSSQISILRQQNWLQRLTDLVDGR